MRYEQKAQRLMKGKGRTYERSYHPLCWDVKMTQATLEFSDIWPVMVKHFFINESEALLNVPDMGAFKESWLQNKQFMLYEDIIESMQRTFVEDGGPDCDTMRCCAPKVYKRFGLPENYSKLFDPKYSFEGRSSGGWLSLNEFEGVQLAYLDREVWGGNTELWGGNTELWYQKLCCQIVSTTITVNGRHDEFKYQAAWRMHRLLTGDE